MSAVQPLADALHAPSSPARARLLEPFASLSPAGLLAHFRARRRETYFPVPDPVETRRARIDAIVAGRFEFNGETHVLGDTPEWLVNASSDVEWHILLHKFYYATGLGMAWADTGDARYVDRWVALTSSWIDTVPPGFIAADVTGRRVQNWIYAYLFFVLRDGKARFPTAFHERLLASIDQQVEYLCTHLTPKRNHRTLELYAIFLASLAFPEFARAADWQRFALAGLVANAESDLLPDGVHCELSTDYHHLVLKNCLCVRRLAAMNGISVPESFDRRLAAALDFSMHVHKPDGIVPSLSDGDARGYRELLRQGHALFGRQDWLYVASGGVAGCPPASPGALFPDAGYAVLRSGWGRGPRAYAQEHYLVFDCGPLGEGNHGHLDCLSFEFAAHGRSLVVDPGRYTYSEAGETNWRVRFRGTEAHNTVSVDGRNQTRYEPKRVVDVATRHKAGSVRHRIGGPAPTVQRRAFVVEDRFGYVCATASSAEYDALHTRHVAYLFGEYWLVVDRLEAPSPHRYDLRFQLGEQAHGRCVLQQRGGVHRVQSPGLVLAVDAEAPARAAIEPSFVSYDYGTRLQAPRVRVTREGRHAWFHTLLQPCDRSATPLELRVLPVRAPGEFPGEARTGATDDPAARPVTVIEIRHPQARGAARDLVLIGSPTATAGDAPWLDEEGRAIAPGLRALRFDAAGRSVECRDAPWVAP
jgi:hypothetical protein